jgi:hypothetical protein
MENGPGSKPGRVPNAANIYSKLNPRYSGNCRNIVTKCGKVKKNHKIVINHKRTDVPTDDG